MTPTLTSPLSPAAMTPSTASLAAARQRQEAKARAALQALQTLKTQRSSADEDKKATARKKVEDLKARIQSLRMTMVGDPEAMARMAAQLARELGAAVKAYAAAGGSSAGLTAATTPADAAVAAEAPAAEASGTGAVDADEEAPNGTAGAAPASRDDASDGDASARADPYRQIIERQQAQAAEQSRRNANKAADDRFAADVKSLVKALKAMLQTAAEAARRKGESPDTPDQATADRALAEIDDALGDITAPAPGLGVSLSV